jgi:callose synthase
VNECKSLVFGTIVQRFMAKPLNVRFHYGHPDVWDLTWVRGQGGVSKAGPYTRPSFGSI